MRLCGLIVAMLCSVCCATAQGLELKRSPIPIPEGEVFTRYMWKDWGLRPPQPIPDNLEDILIEKEFWSLFEFFPKIVDGELHFEFDVFGTSPLFALQFKPSRKDCILHTSMPACEVGVSPYVEPSVLNNKDELWREGYHFATDYAKPLTVIYYDGHKVVVTEEVINKNNLPAQVKAYILTPLTEGQFYLQINKCCYPILGNAKIYKNLPATVAPPIEQKPIGRAELLAVKPRKIKKILTR